LKNRRYKRKLNLVFNPNNMSTSG